MGIYFVVYEDVCLILGVKKFQTVRHLRKNKQTINNINDSIKFKYLMTRF